MGLVLVAIQIRAYARPPKRALHHAERIEQNIRTNPIKGIVGGAAMITSIIAWAAGSRPIEPKDLSRK